MSLADISTALVIPPSLILKWERGIECIPAQMFVELMQTMGDSSLRRAAEFDLNLQIEKHLLLTQGMSFDFTGTNIHILHPIAPEFDPEPPVAVAASA